MSCPIKLLLSSVSCGCLWLHLSVVAREIAGTLHPSFSVVLGLLTSGPLLKNGYVKKRSYLPTLTQKAFSSGFLRYTLVVFVYMENKNKNYTAERNHGHN